MPTNKDTLAATKNKKRIRAWVWSILFVIAAVGWIADFSYTYLTYQRNNVPVYLEHGSKGKEFWTLRPTGELTNPAIDFSVSMFMLLLILGVLLYLPIRNKLNNTLLAIAVDIVAATAIWLSLTYWAAYYTYQDTATMLKAVISRLVVGTLFFAVLCIAGWQVAKFQKRRKRNKR